MRKLFTAFSLVALTVSSANAQVYLNEMLANPPGGDGSFEYFELRGTPSLSLSGYYLLSLEGEGSTGRGDVNQFFNLGSFALGANGYLVAFQSNSPYAPTVAGATVIQNSGSAGWGQANTALGSSVGHSSDGTQTDLENSATTILLANIGIGSAPTLSLDMDTDNDGLLDLPAGWSIVDSVGLLDGVGAAPTNFSYGVITFRVGGVGGSAYGNIVDVPGSGSSLYVGRKGESTGSTADDWFGSILSGSGGSFTFSSPTDSSYAGQSISTMNFGGPNPVPEPTTFVLLGLGLGAVLLCRSRR